MTEYRHDFWRSSERKNKGHVLQTGRCARTTRQTTLQAKAHYHCGRQTIRECAWFSASRYRALVGLRIQRLWPRFPLSRWLVASARIFARPPFYGSDRQPL
jgi:hypothetical protein